MTTPLDAHRDIAGQALTEQEHCPLTLYRVTHAPPAAPVWRLARHETEFAALSDVIATQQGATPTVASTLHALVGHVAGNPGTAYTYPLSEGAIVGAAMVYSGWAVPAAKDPAAAAHVRRGGALAVAAHPHRLKVRMAVLYLTHNDTYTYRYFTLSDNTVIERTPGRGMLLSSDHPRGLRLLYQQWRARQISAEGHHDSAAP